MLNNPDQRVLREQMPRESDAFALRVGMFARPYPSSKIPRAEWGKAVDGYTVGASYS
jgi:hypothetical protein